MLFTPFSKTWWKSLVKGEGTEPLVEAAEQLAADLELEPDTEEGFAPEPERPARAEQPRHLPRSPRAQLASSADSEEPHDDDLDHEPFTHEGQPAELVNDDPLAPAFDLERGVPLSTAVQQQQQEVYEPRVNVRSAKEFFNSEILYRFDILEDIDRRELLGSYRIELKGYQGGVWTIVVGDHVEVMNRREDADIIITMHQKDFLQLVNGQLNPQLAIFAQKMRVQGDLRRCISFDRLLTPYTD